MKKESIKKLVAAALVCGSIFGMSNGAYAAEQKSTGNNSGSAVSSSDNEDSESARGWKLEGKEGKDYFYKDGVLQKDKIITVWGTKYKCDKDGVVVGDLVSDSNDVDKYMHQFSEDYKNHDNRWKKVNGNWHFCYLEENEKYSETNIDKDQWTEINKYWYHFDKNGNMDKNTTIKDDYGNECRLNADGALINREKPEVKYKYAEDETEPSITLTNKDGKTYALDKQGNKKTKWVMISGKWYYCNQDGVVQKNTSVIENGTKYIFDKDGVWVNY